MLLRDPEATFPLYTYLTEAPDDTRTISISKWQQNVHNQNFEFLDLAQRSFYLLLCRKLAIFSLGHTVA
jgi:hypothetical protein